MFHNRRLWCCLTIDDRNFISVFINKSIFVNKTTSAQDNERKENYSNPSGQSSLSQASNMSASEAALTHDQFIHAARIELERNLEQLAREAFPEKYSSVIFHTFKSNWSKCQESNSVQMPRIKTLQVIKGDVMVTGRCVLKEPSTFFQISRILDITDWDIMFYPEQCLFPRFGLKLKDFETIWDPWVLNSDKVTKSALKDFIPTDMITIIQDLTHVQDQHIDSN